MSLPPPQGMTEVDYEAIEAAVTETVRGRWFLGEFARRNRTGEMRVLMEAMARLETRIETKLESGGQPALPSADPSIRMLIQRIKEVAAQLEDVSRDMRDEGVESRFVEAVELQARAVSGMMRGASSAKAPVPEKIAGPLAAQPTPSRLTPSVMRMPRANLPASLAPIPTPPASGPETADPRLAALSELDGLPLAKKLAAFS